jgi:hypothetical protein
MPERSLDTNKHPGSGRVLRHPYKIYSLIGTATFFRVRMGPLEGSEKGSYYLLMKEISFV